jgi:GAF domain-containing protein
MPFSARLRQSLFDRDCEVASEFRRGDSLEEVLDRHLLAVEAMAEGELLTSILLLSDDGKRLFHGAAPNLPSSYRDLIDGMEIGPSAGSCGTAAFFGRPVYVSDVETDPLWTDYRDLALSHGLRSCWSTPIRDEDGVLTATFAIYRRTPGEPSADERSAIDTITCHVARAIGRARRESGIENSWAFAREARHLTLVSDNRTLSSFEDRHFGRLLGKAERLEELAGRLEEQAARCDDPADRQAIDALAKDSLKLVEVIRSKISPQGDRS